MVKSFKFSHTHQFSQAEYIALQSAFSGKNRPVRIVLALLLGIALLFWSFTLLLGIAVLVTVALILFMPRVLPGTAARTFAKKSFLHGPLTYAVSESELSIRGRTIDLSCSWENLAVWREVAGWLVLSAYGMQELYFPLEALRDAEVYDSIIAIARQHAVEYGSPEAYAA